MEKRKRVPEVLWRLFSNGARPLAETIVSLLPQACDCNSRGKCLRCVFGNGNQAAMSYLIRHDDPSEYQKLMKRCFVVIPLHAPPLPPLLSFTLRWSQLQIVEKTIETFFSKQAAPSNVICIGYQKFKMISSVIKLLTHSTWDLALKRIGDCVMEYLLMNTLIFVPIRRNAHQQVAGPPANLHIPRPDSESSIYARHQRKRRRSKRNNSLCEEPPRKAPFKAGHQNSFDCVGSRNEDYIGTQCPEMSDGQCSDRKDVIKGKPNEKLKGNLGKRSRLPSWQRRKRRERFTTQDSYSLEPSIEVLNDESLHKTHPHGSIKNDLQCKTIDNHDGANLISNQPMPLLCPCCSVLQSLSQVPKDAQINRKAIFYSLEYSSSLFLKNHFLYSLNAGFSGANDLTRHILGLSSIATSGLPASCFHNHGLCANGSPCLYHSLVKLHKVLLRRAKHCQHKKLLEKHCSIQRRLADGNAGCILQKSKMEGKSASFDQKVNQEINHPLKRSFHTESKDCKRTTEVIQHQFGLSRPYCLKDEVVSFVWAVCRNIVPRDLLGLPSSQRTLRRNISRFIKLRRFEKFSLKQCTHKLEISKFPFLLNKQSLKCSNVSHGIKKVGHCAFKQYLLERWIFWFFTCIVVPLVQANFYVTESEHGKQNLYYYRKSVWGKLSDRVTTSLKNQSYRSLNNASVGQILSKRSFGFSKVRLCPKENEARPIANLKKPSKFCIQGFHSRAKFRGNQRQGQFRKRTRNANATYFKSVNCVLQDLQVVFKDLRMKEPEKWGSTVFSYNDIYRKLCPFLRTLKEGQAAMPTVYIVVSDVKKAFDTVNQDKLLTILNEIQMEDKYTLQKSSEIFYRKKSLWVSENRQLITQGNKSGYAEVMPSVRWRTSHTLLVDKEQSKTIKNEELKLNLEEHLKNNVVKLGQRFFLQVVGIPQGSVLSSLLCSLYYGHLERNVIFPFLAKDASDTLDRDGHDCAPKYLLLRFLDDFLFLSTSKKQAATFFSRLRRGFREYNCYMNQEKFCKNFDIGCILGLDSKRLLVGSDGASFLQWSGLLINSCSLEVQADYTRYLNDDLSSTLTVSWQDRPRRRLKAKLCAYMRPKCHPIFFDTTINSPATVRLNVYQAFVLCAMKFHCYVRELSKECKLHPMSYLSSIERSIRYMYKLMKRKMYKVNIDCNSQPVLQVRKEEVMWLGLTAYVRVLSRKQSRHRELLQLLRASLVPLSSIGFSPELKYAVDDFHSSFLWKIKY